MLEEKVLLKSSLDYVLDNLLLKYQNTQYERDILSLKPNNQFAEYDSSWKDLWCANSLVGALKLKQILLNTSLQDRPTHST